MRTGNDCYYANKRPDWGVLGDTTDDPLLDVDQTDGYGPENITLKKGENGLYKVYVHYYYDNGNGPSLASVQIFLNGQSSLVTKPHFMQPYDLWYVADVDIVNKKVYPR